MFCDCTDVSLPLADIVTLHNDSLSEMMKQVLSNVWIPLDKVRSVPSLTLCDCWLELSPILLHSYRLAQTEPFYTLDNSNSCVLTVERLLILNASVHLQALFK